MNLFTQFGNVYFHIFFIQEGFNVIEGNGIDNIVVLQMNMAANNACRSILNNGNFTITRFYMYPTAFYCSRHSSNRVMTAHVQVSAGIHENNTVIGFFMNRFANECTEHILMTSCFKHYCFTKVIFVFFQVNLLFCHCLTGEFRNPADNQASCFARRMRVDGRKHS